MPGPRSTPENLEVLFEDNHLIVVNKKAGDLAQGDKTGDAPLSEVVKAYLKVKYDKPGAVFLGVVHRLDRPTTGALIFARTSKALSRLNAMFAGTEVQKTYWAVTQNPPPQAQGRLEHWLSRNSKQNKSYAMPGPGPDRKRAALSYRYLKKLQRYHLVEIRLETGRHHQIRAQLAAIGCPIKGDLKYGAARSNPDGSIHLHARSLEFIHPVRKTPVRLTAPLPPDPVWDACLD